MGWGHPLPDHGQTAWRVNHASGVDRGGGASSWSARGLQAMPFLQIVGWVQYGCVCGSRDTAPPRRASPAGRDGGEELGVWTRCAGMAEAPRIVTTVWHKNPCRHRP